MSIKSLAMYSKLLDTKTPRKSVIPANLNKPSCNDIEEGTSLKRATLNEVGLNSVKVAEFIEELYNNDSCNPHNLMIVKNGKIVLDAYFGIQKKGVWKATFSACKSITSIAIGMLIDDGKLTLQTKLEDVFTSEMSSIAKARMRGMTVYDLLTMTSGMKSFEETGILCESDVLKAYFSTPLSFEPKAKFVYNSTNTFVLSAIVKKISGQSLFDFLKARLFEPLGIKKIYWEKAPDGNDYGGFGLYILPEDFAKIAIMMLNGGVYENKQILSRKYIESATARQIKTDKKAYRYDYGFQIWAGRNNNEYLFNGMLGQNILTIKDKNLIIVSNCGNDDNYQQGIFFDCVNKYFYDAEMYKPTLIDGGRLKNALKYIQTNKLLFLIDEKERKKIEKGNLPSNISEYVGKTYETEDKRRATMSIFPFSWQVFSNNYSKGFKSISFEEISGTFNMIYREVDQSFVIPVGFDKPKYSEIKIHNVPYEIGVLGGFFVNDDGKKIFRIQVDFIETPCSTVLKFYKSGKKLKMYQKDVPGALFLENNLSLLKDEISQNKLIGNATNLLPTDDLNFLIERLFETKVEIKEV